MEMKQLTSVALTFEESNDLIRNSKIIQKQPSLALFTLPSQIRRAKYLARPFRSTI